MCWKFAFKFDVSCKDYNKLFVKISNVWWGACSIQRMRVWIFNSVCKTILNVLLKLLIRFRKPIRVFIFLCRSSVYVYAHPNILQYNCVYIYAYILEYSTIHYVYIYKVTVFWCKKKIERQKVEYRIAFIIHDIRKRIMMVNLVQQRLIMVCCRFYGKMHWFPTTEPKHIYIYT